MKLTAIVVWAFLFVATGFSLFNIAFQVDELESRLSSLQNEIAKEEETLKVLEAEWAYLNRPDRLSTLQQDLLPHLTLPRLDQIGGFDQIPLPVALPVSDEEASESLAEENSPEASEQKRPKPIVPTAEAAPATQAKATKNDLNGGIKISAPVAPAETQGTDLGSMVRHALSQKGDE